MKHIAKTKIEVEITFEYDDEHYNFFSPKLAKATAIDLAIQPSRDTEDGVRLLEVCNKKKDIWWMIQNNGETYT